MKITWNKNIEPEHKAEIEKHIIPFLWFLPGWCQQIHINLFSESGKNSNIEATVNDEYRFIQLDFFTAWLNSPEEEKRNNVIHEFTHGFVNPLYNQAYRLIKKAAKDNEELKELALAELARTVESVTQDLTYAVLEKFNER